MAWLGLLLLMLHFTISDRFAWLALIYLLTPFPIIGVLFLPYALQRWCAGLKRTAVVLTLVAGAIPTWHFIRPALTSEVLHLNAASSESLKVVFWTPDHLEFTTVDEVFAYLATFDADIIAMVEGNVDHGRQKARAAELFPDYRMELLPMAMLLLHRGEVLEQTYHTVGNDSGFLNLCILKINGRELVVGIYDQVSNPLRRRTPAIREVRDLLAPFADGELLLMGDFNVPRTAYSVNQLGDILQPAFSCFENINPYTWPEAFPFLAIDQVWFSDALSIRDARVVDTGLANHRLLSFQLPLLLPRVDSK